MYNPLKIYRREWPGVALTVIVLGTLHALSISKFLPLFSHHLHGGLWKVFIEHYHISGYDPKMYSIITRWSTEYDVSRHPLLNLLLYPLYHFNKWLMQQTGINCMQFIVAALLLACAVYSFVYLFRILSRVLRLSWADSMLLSGLFFSLAYVELALLVPDHFALSMTLLLYTLYVAGMKMRNGRGFRVWQAALLLTVTAGTTLTNGVKTLMALIATNYRRLLGWRMMLLGIVVPSLLLVGLSRYQTYTFAMPRLAAMKKANAAKPTDSVQMKKNQMVRENLASRPYIDKGPLAMTDASTPRVATAVENLLVELCSRSALRCLACSRLVGCKEEAVYAPHGRFLLLRYAPSLRAGLCRQRNLHYDSPLEHRHPRGSGLSATHGQVHGVVAHGNCGAHNVALHPQHRDAIQCASGVSERTGWSLSVCGHRPDA